MEMSKLMRSLLSCIFACLEWWGDNNNDTNKQKEQELEINEFKGDVLQIVVDYMWLKKKYWQELV